MKANTTFWAYNTGNFLTYFASALCGRLSHMTDPIKYDIIRQVRSVPPPSCLGTFDDFNKHNVISQRKSKWLILLTSTWQWILHAATIETLNALIKRSQYHFLPLAVGRYKPKSQSKTSTPSTPIRFGWATEQSLSFFTVCFVWLTGMWLVKLRPIDTIALSFHLQKYTLP